MGAIFLNLLSKHPTKLGIAGAILYVSTTLALAIIHRSLDLALQALGYGGLAMMAWGVSTLVVKTSADAMVARTDIANAVREETKSAASSTVPAVEREIAKIRLTQ